MTCPNCGSVLDDRSQYCNHCGQAQQANPPPPPEGYPPPGYEYQQPQASSQGLQGIGDALGGKGYLVLAVFCFAMAFFGFLNRIGFIISMFSRNWGTFSGSYFTNFFSLGTRVILPLTAGFILLGMHQRNNTQ